MEEIQWVYIRFWIYWTFLDKLWYTGDSKVIPNPSLLPPSHYRGEVETHFLEASFTATDSHVTPLWSMNCKRKLLDRWFDKDKSFLVKSFASIFRLWREGKGNHRTFHQPKLPYIKLLNQCQQASILDFVILDKQAPLA